MENRPHNQVRTVKPDGNHSTNTNQVKQTLRINSERQYRLILAILETARSTTDLIHIVGANNVPDVVMCLRRKGWNIHTKLVTVEDRDGKKAEAGTYKLDESQIEQAKEALKAFYSKQNRKEVNYE